MAELPVFTRRGDARSEVDKRVAALGGPEAAGLHRAMHVTKADMTVVMVTSRDAPLAEALRKQQGWTEPTE